MRCGCLCLEIHSGRYPFFSSVSLRPSLLTRTVHFVGVNYCSSTRQRRTRKITDSISPIACFDQVYLTLNITYLHRDLRIDDVERNGGDNHRLFSHAWFVVWLDLMNGRAHRFHILCLDPTDAESNPSLASDSHSSLSSSAVDDEERRRMILSKLWGKGNKLSHKVRELDKSTMSNNDHDQQQQLADNLHEQSSCSFTPESKATTDDNANSISISKPLAVVKPIVVMKADLTAAHDNDRTHTSGEALASSSIQTNRTATTVIERQSSSKATDERSPKKKKKKSHSNEDSKAKKATRDRSKHHHDRDVRMRERRLGDTMIREHDHCIFQSHGSTTKVTSTSSAENHRTNRDESNSNSTSHHKSSRYRSTLSTSMADSKRRSPSNGKDHKQRDSSRSTAQRVQFFSRSRSLHVSSVGKCLERRIAIVSPLRCHWRENSRVAQSSLHIALPR